MLRIVGHAVTAPVAWSLPNSRRVWQSVYDGPKERQNSRITRPKVLLVVGHPSIGAALETLLRIEDRFEVRRAQSIEQAVAGLDGWTPDLALVDGVLVPSGRTEELAMPAIVLSGNAADGKRLGPRFADGRGWLRKDATANELRVAIDRVLGGRRPWARRGQGSRGSRLLAVVLLGLVVIALAWYALRVRGQRWRKTTRTTR